VILPSRRGPRPPGCDIHTRPVPQQVPQAGERPVPEGLTALPAVQVVLVEPLIPPNTGNISRLCVATGSRLHLVRPIGFDISEKAVRRAGLDYWPHLDLRVHDDWAAFVDGEDREGARFFFYTVRGGVPFTRARHRAGDYLVFGKETTGLGDAQLDFAGPSRLYRIPMFGKVRSLNLSNAVALAVYGALWQVRPEDF